jgi:hypothetical protein
MKSLLGVLHGGLWIRVMVCRNLRQAHLQEVGLTKIPGEIMIFLIFFSMTDFRIDCKADSIAYSKIDFRDDKHHQIFLLK